MKIFTIGFTKKNARVFFESLKGSGAERLIDVRLNNISQLAGFAKKDDLEYFLDKICNIKYLHFPDLAPTQEMLSGYRKKIILWEQYETMFMELMKKRKIETILQKDIISNSCLLCSEDKPQYCHRRLVIRYLQECWGNIEAIHL